jgi:tRNA (guanine-N7-)-methyltransferase
MIRSESFNGLIWAHNGSSALSAANVIYFEPMARGRHPTRIHIAPPDEHTAAKYLRSWDGSQLRSEPAGFPGLTSRELFGNDRPLEIDFGCGTGVLSCSRAQRYPDVNFIGIDQSQKPIFCAIRDAVSLNLENIMFLRGDLNLLLPLLRPQTVSAAYYLFPNPPLDYHKERANARRRLFLESIYNALVPGGTFIFATDSNVLFGNMSDILHNQLHYKSHTPNFAAFNFGTRYQRIWEERGRSVKSFVIEKGDGAQNGLIHRS